MIARRWRWLLAAVVMGLILLFGVPLVFSLLPRSASDTEGAELPYVEIVDEAPAAPILTVTGDTQAIYQIDPAQSQARYGVQEIILNSMDGRTVVGSTQAISGDIFLDFATPSNSQLGEIVISVSSLESDSSLRDQHLRAEYLESERYPAVRFVQERIIGLPDVIEIGTAYSVQIEGYLTVKAITARITWDVMLTLEVDRLVGSATTQIQMSTFEVGPINLIGWLQTDDVMQLSFDFVAASDAPTPTAALPESAEATAPAPVAPSNINSEFNRDIRPILEANCVACHTTGQIGFSVYPMVTVQDVISVADDLAFLVQSGYMPPWPPGDTMPPLEHDRSLTEAEIATLVAWADAGAPVNGDLDAPLAVSTENAIQIRIDLVLPMPEPYLAPEGRTDDYRCFVLDPKIESPRYITGYEVIPGSISIVHHVLVFPMPAQAQALADAKSGADGRPGWECFGGPGLPGIETNTAIAPGWVPGAGANQFPADTGILLNPGDLLVFQAHYNLEAGTIPDQSRLVLELSEIGGSLVALQGIGLAAPVEIPCPAAYQRTEPCQRQTAVRDSETRDPDAGLLSDALLVLCGRGLNDYREQDAARVESVCDSTAPISGQGIQVNGHMHRLGTSVTITLNPDSENAQILLDLPHWDFDWQENYTFVQPIQINEGDVLRLTCTWDNTRGIETANAPQDTASAYSWFGIQPALAHNTVQTHPFRYVTWGEDTRDEMCLAAVIVIPDPAYYGVTLTDEGEGSEIALYAGILWMRLLRQPVLLMSLLTGTGVLLAGAGVAYRRYRKH